MRGYRSKEHSLKKIIKKLKPAVVVINESQLVGNMEVSLSPYISWTKNRTQKGGGGVATAVSHIFKDTAVGAGEGLEDD